VFFLGCSPTFNEESFEHLEHVVEQFK
jgi:hypothetical protein